jgi:hypothetical protein
MVILENGNRIKSMGKVLIFTLIVKDMKVYGKRIKNKEMVNTNIRMEIFI